MEHVIWCNSCQSEPAVVTIEVEFDGEWAPLDIGEQCLTRLQEDGKMN